MVVFVIGGSGSGKSEYAENLAVSFRKQEGDRLVYVATMKPGDEESQARIRRHRKQRAGKGFETRECYTGLEELPVKEHEIILLECLSNLTANEMFSENCRKESAAGRIWQGILHLAEHARHLVIVGNNVFEDGMEYDSTTMEYLEQMAEIHGRLGTMADRVVEVICGIPIEWKAGFQECRNTSDDRTKGGWL